MANISAAVAARKVAAQAYSPQQACRHARITKQQLKAWQRLGLIADVTEFQYGDVLALRALGAMKAAGLAGRDLVNAVARLAGTPRNTQPLAHVRIVKRGRRVFAKLPDHEIELRSGQTGFSFDTAATVGLEKPAPKQDQKRRAEAESWFQRGLELEHAGASQEEIVAAYRKAVELDDQSAGAFVNLGTVYFNSRRWREAERYYRKALEADPSYPLAHFNLANLFDENGDRRAAQQHYLEAIRLRPGYADAHYNLALLFQSGGQTMKAIQHWKTYLSLDASSSWAAIARREMKKLQQASLVSGPRAMDAE